MKYKMAHFTFFVAFLSNSAFKGETQSFLLLFKIFLSELLAQVWFGLQLTPPQLTLLFFGAWSTEFGFVKTQVTFTTVFISYAAKTGATVVPTSFLSKEL